MSRRTRLAWRSPIEILSLLGFGVLLAAGVWSLMAGYSL